METQLIIFLAFTSVTIITNTLLVLFAYKSFANVTTKISRGIQEFETNDATRSWISNLDSATKSAATLSSQAKEKMLEFDPVLERMQNKLGDMLATADKKGEDLGNSLTLNAARMRDSVAKPAYSIGAFAAGLHSVLGAIQNRESEN